MKTRVVFVCLGNICRSPTAEGVMRHVLRERGLTDFYEIDSAGTGAYHVGESPDSRSTEFAKRRGIVLEGAARKFVAEDFKTFDYVLAMDRSNFANMKKLATSDEDLRRLQLFLEYDAESPKGAEVPDPYYGGDAGFENVLDLCQRACEGLIDSIERQRG